MAAAGAERAGRSLGAPAAVVAEVGRIEAAAARAAALVEAEEAERGVEYYCEQLRTSGFTVVPNVIPADRVDEIRASVERAQERIGADARALEGGTPWEELWPELAAEERPTGPLADQLRNFGGHPRLSQLAYTSALNEYLCDPRILGIARSMIDDHVRIGQCAIGKTRPVLTTDETLLPAPGAGDARASDGRLWHTDWPHDVVCYGGGVGNPEANVGSLALPFPDVCSESWPISPFADSLRPADMHSGALDRLGFHPRQRVHGRQYGRCWVISRPALPPRTR